MSAPEWSWQTQAACRGESLVLFFGPQGERQPERDVRERKAKAICAQCPVRRECLTYALSVPEKNGLWGGLNEDERASERRRRMRRAGTARLASEMDQPVAVPAADEAPEPAAGPEPDTKYCGNCRRALPVDLFSRDVTKKDGLNGWCRACSNQARTERRQTDSHDVKVCRTCGETKPVSKFYREAKSPDGLRLDCKSCYKALRAERQTEQAVAS
jgi:WhiB family redox-sensing transcriptional regulator